MNKVLEAQDILKALGLPPAQQNEMSALTLLALCGLEENDIWKSTSSHSVTISKDIMTFVSQKYHKPYAPNTRETFRRHVLHQFVQAGIARYNPDNSNLPTNSPNAHYALSNAAENAIRSYGTTRWQKAVNRYLENNGSLLEKYQKKRMLDKIPVKLPNGKEVQLSPGEHNIVQAAIIEQFAPRFIQNSELLYFGDTAQKNLIIEEKRLDTIGIHITDHNKLPDVVLLDNSRNWLFLIEAVTSHGPMTPKRVMELEVMLAKCPLGKVYVSAFPDFSEFRKHINEISWETEVWVVEFPDHMIHYKGDKFLGPHQTLRSQSI